MEKKVNELFVERIQARLPGDDPDQPGSAIGAFQSPFSSEPRGLILFY